MNAIARPWVCEVSEAAHRGRSFSLVSFANYTRIAFAYWLFFGPIFIDGGMGPIDWHLPFAVNGIFPLLLFFLLLLPPESPCYRLLKDREGEALELLAPTCSNCDQTIRNVLAEVTESVAISKQNKEMNSFWGLLTGRGFGRFHFARRTHLALRPRLFTYIGAGVAATTIHTPTLLETAGFSTEKTDWLAALNNTVWIFGTIGLFETSSPFNRAMENNYPSSRERGSLGHKSTESQAAVVEMENMGSEQSI